MFLQRGGNEQKIFGAQKPLRGPKSGIRPIAWLIWTAECVLENYENR
jgi:hypothetical protein